MHVHQVPQSETGCHVTLSSRNNVGPLSIPITIPYIQYSRHRSVPLVISGLAVFSLSLYSCTNPMNDPLNPFLQGSVSLPKSLHHVLVDLHHQPYSHVPNPPSCKKRASVALILRVRPTYDHWPASPSPSSSHAHAGEKLNTFFAQEWVQHGEPEVLFIKRATRTGDRWTGHVALPGGKRDPEDPDDQAAATRETSEEIGLDLATEDCIPVGNLPERVVTTSWGAVP